VLDGAQKPWHHQASHLISQHPGSPHHSLLSRTPPLSIKALLLLLPSPPTAPLPTGEAEQEQGCAEAGQPLLGSPSPKGGLDPYITLLHSPWQCRKEQEPSLPLGVGPHGAGLHWGTAGQALPWEGLS